MNKKENDLRKNIIESKLTNITDSINLVTEHLPPETDEFKTLGIIKDGIYKKIEFAIENIMDICSIINADLGLGMPEAEEDILENLENKNIFDKKFIELVREMKRFRNLLVHRYGKIDDEKAFSTISEGLKDFEYIIDKIEELLKKHG